MKTFRTALIGKLEEHGLWPAEAEAVMKAVEDAPESDAMKGRWNDDPSGYPPILLNIAWVCAKKKAVEWIDEFKPQHFARAMFL